MGRRIEEREARQVRDAMGGEAPTIASVSRSFDADGNVLSTSINGALTEQNTYDALGRLTSKRSGVNDAVLADVAQMPIDGLGAESLYTSVAQLSTTRFDGFGNVVEVRDYANGASGGTAAVASDKDRVQIQRYDWAGRSVWQSDAAGTQCIRVYDAADHLLRTSYRLSGNEGRSTLVQAEAEYDSLGRQIGSSVSRISLASDGTERVNPYETVGS